MFFVIICVKENVIINKSGILMNLKIHSKPILIYIQNRYLVKMWDSTCKCIGDIKVILTD